MKFKNKAIANSVVAALIISISGCASIIGKSSYPVTIKSNQDGTHFVVKDSSGESVHTGDTPSTVTLNSSEGYFKKAKYTIVFSKDGYTDQTVSLVSGLDGWYFGNILLGGLIGMLIVDPITGAMWKLPDDISGSLVKKDVANLESGIAPELQVVALDQIPVELRGQLVRLN